MSSFKIKPNLEQVFRFCDVNGDGRISRAELHSIIGGEKLMAEDAEKVVKLLDSDRDWLLCFEDFARLVDVEDEDERERSMRETFGVDEMEGRGFITVVSLGSALGMLGVRNSLKECREMIKEFDLNGDGVIFFEEFRIMMM